MFTSLPVLAVILTVPINILAVTTPPYCTTYYGSTSVSSLKTSFAVSTLTTTITQSVVYATTTVTTGITTIPTPSGFTPIFSETTSVSLEILVANAATADPSTSYPASVDCTATYTTTITKTPTAGQQAGTTVTSFLSTVTVPATTFYAACDSNNIVDQGFGVGAGHAISFFAAHDYPYNSSLISNSSASDCCVSCLTSYLCSWSVLFTNYGSENPLECTLYFREDGICDGGFSAGPAENYYDPDSTAQPGQELIVSNGACGQIIYGGGWL